MYRETVEFEFKKDLAPVRFWLLGNISRKSFLFKGQTDKLDFDSTNKLHFGQVWFWSMYRMIIHGFDPMLDPAGDINPDTKTHQNHRFGLGLPNTCSVHLIPRIFFMKRVDWLSATAFEKLPSWPYLKSCGSYFDIFFIWKNHISDFTTTAIVIRHVRPMRHWQTPDYRVKLDRNERSSTSAGVSCKYFFILVFRVLGLWHNFFDSKVIERRH